MVDLPLGCTPELGHFLFDPVEAIETGIDLRTHDLQTLIRCNLSLFHAPKVIGQSVESLRQFLLKLQPLGLQPSQ